MEIDSLSISSNVRSLPARTAKFQLQCKLPVVVQDYAGIFEWNQQSCCRGSTFAKAGSSYPTAISEFGSNSSLMSLVVLETLLLQSW